MGHNGYPTQSLKNLHRRKGGGYFGLCIKIYKAIGTLPAKQTSNRIAANDCNEPKATAFYIATHGGLPSKFCF